MILDALVIIVIAVFVIIGFLKGAVKSVVSAVGTFAASAFSLFLSNPIAQYIYRTAIKSSLTEKFEEAIKTSQAGVSGNLVERTLDTLPDFVKDSMFNFGISTKELSGAISKGAEAIETLLAPIVISFISVIVACVLFTVILVIIKIISKIVCSAIDSSVLSFPNKFLGALIGLVEGFVIVFIAMFILRLCIPHMEEVPEIISDYSISKTTVFEGIYDSDILTGMISAHSESPNHSSTAE